MVTTTRSMTRTRSQKLAEVKAEWQGKRDGTRRGRTVSSRQQLTKAQKLAKVKAEWEAKKSEGGPPRQRRERQAVVPIVQSNNHGNDDDDSLDKVPFIPLPDLALPRPRKSKRSAIATWLAWAVLAMTVVGFATVVVSTLDFHPSSPGNGVVVLQSPPHVVTVLPLNQSWSRSSSPSPSSSNAMAVVDRWEPCNNNTTTATVVVTSSNLTLNDSTVVSMASNESLVSGNGGVEPSLPPTLQIPQFITNISWRVVVCWILRWCAYSCFSLARFLCVALYGGYGPVCQCCVALYVLRRFFVAYRVCCMRDRLQELGAFSIELLSNNPHRRYSADKLFQNFARSRRGVWQRMWIDRDAHCMSKILGQHFARNPNTQCVVCLENGKRVTKFQWRG